MPNEGSLRAIKDAREKKRKREADLAAELKTLTDRVNHLEQSILSAMKAVKDLVGANNASALVVSSVERWMDSNHPGWDEGIREDLQKRSALVQEGKQIRTLFMSVPKGAEGGPTDAERGRAAARLWEVSKEIGTALQDGPLCISLYLQAGLPADARALLVEYRGLHAEIPPQLDVVLRKLEERTAEVERKERRIWTPGDR